MTTSFYADVDELKATLSLTGTTYDADLETAILAVSAAIDECCDTVFQLSDDSNDELRVFTPSGPSVVVFDDLAAFTLLEVDSDGDGVFDTEWTLGSDFVLWPENAAARGRPFNRASVNPRSGKAFPRGPQSVRVTGRYGWPQVPWQIREAAKLLTTQLWKRQRETPFGILSIGIDQATAARVLRYDPHLQTLIEPFHREAMIA